MAITAKGTDRFAFGVLYLFVGSIILWAGFRILNHSLEIRFFKDYLVQWETEVSAFTVQHGVWPVFNGSNHAQYMESLALSMAKAGVKLPRSNTPVFYRYKVERFGHKEENIFLLCLHDRFILYGLSDKTLHHLDKAVDGNIDLTQGRVSGRLGTSGKTYIGQVRL